MEVIESSVLIVGNPQGILSQQLRPHIVPLLTLIITLPHPTLPYPTLPYPTLPYPTLPYPTLPE
jgi:hypothetical protein